MMAFQGTSSERVALIRVGMDTSSAEQGAKNLANYFEEADKAAKKLEDGADNAGAGLEGLGESSQKLSVLIGQQGLAGDLMDVFEGLEGVSSMLGPAGTAAAVAAASFALFAAGAVAAQAAMYDLTKATIEADEAVGRKLTPALEDAKRTMEGWDGASQRASRTMTESLAPAFRTLSEVFTGLKADLVWMTSGVVDFGTKVSSSLGEYDLSKAQGQAEILDQRAYNIVRRGILDVATLGTYEINRAAGGTLTSLMWERLRGQGAAEMSAGLFEVNEGKLTSAMGGSGQKLLEAQDEATKATKDHAASAAKLAEAQKLAAEQLMAEALAGSPAAFEEWRRTTGAAASARSFAQYQGAGFATRGWAGITGEEWAEPEAMSRAQRRDYLRMASGQDPREPRGIGGFMSGLQGAQALAGGMGGISSALGAAGPYGAAAAAGIGILSDPQALVKGANEVGKFVEKLPDQIGVMLTEVLPKLMEKLPMILADLVKAVLIDIPGILISALKDWWYDVRHTTDAERRQRDKGLEAQFKAARRQYGAHGADQMMRDMYGSAWAQSSSNPRNARSSAPRRPDYSLMQGGPRTPVTLTAGVTDDSARAIKRKLAQQTRGGQR